MTQYAKLENGRLIFAPKNKGAIANYNLSVDLMTADGYKPFVQTIRPSTERLYEINYEENNGNICEVVNYLETEENYNLRQETENNQLAERAAPKIIELVGDVTGSANLDINSSIQILTTLANASSGGGTTTNTTHGSCFDSGSGLKIQSLFFANSGYTYSNTSTTMNLTIPFDVAMNSTNYIAVWNYYYSAYTSTVTGWSGSAIPAGYAEPLVGIKNSPTHTLSNDKFIYRYSTGPSMSGTPSSVTNISVIVIGF